MKMIRNFSRHLLLCLGLTGGLLSTMTDTAIATETSTPGSVAIFYGANPPANSLSQFDRIILESENIRPSELLKLKQHGSDTYAYLSIGEVGPQRSFRSEIDPSWTMGVNTSWDSTVMDMSSAGWNQFVLQRVDQLVQQGYSGLFLDTMDSYQIYSKDTHARSAQENALANLIYQIKRRHPSVKLIANRGFEVMDQVGQYMDAVAAESLYSRWNNEAGEYQAVPQGDREWLYGKLAAIQSKHNVDIISIDYVAPSERDKAREVAKQIAALGFIPWVSNPSLDYVGISNIEVTPREVLMLYNSEINGKIEQSEVHLLLSMPLEYMGYVPVYHDIIEKGLPQGILQGAYAGAVMWHRDNVADSGYLDWLLKQVDENFPLAFFGSFGTNFNSTLGGKLGLTATLTPDPYSLKAYSGTDMVGFEAPVLQRIDTFSQAVKVADPKNTSHLRYKDKNDVEIDTLITGPWGGIAVYPTIIDLALDEISDWIINPFDFLKTSLKLVDAPMPDITSEHGTRMWFAHIDGDAMPSWAELPGRQLGSEIVRDQIITKYELPHAISVVEAEMYTEDRRERMEQTARDLFALDYVEIATHTFSHPFHWQELPEGFPSGTENLPVPGYLFNIDREIGGSARYIDENLAPPGKRTKVTLWSGDAIPLENHIATVGKHNMINMNGGYTVISKEFPSVSAISASVRVVGDQTQIYAPIMNENIYTNEWLGPFDGFRRVIETFDMTGFPRRIKPVNVYYHFYIGTKKAAIRSLEEIYDWTIQQDLIPVVPSHYIVKVPDYRTAGVARYLDGRWKVTGLGNIKSLRTLKPNSFPDLASSSSLIGTAETHDATYIHTDGSNSVTFAMQPQKPAEPYLVTSNALVEHWQSHHNSTISVRLAGALPIKLEIGGSHSHCTLTAHGETVRGQRTPEGNTRFNLSTKDTGDAIINCKA